MESTPTYPKNTFSQSERLKSRKIIEDIFRRKLFINKGSVSCFYMEQTDTKISPVQFGFTVSKKNFALATQRNRIKRLMRESVRLRKNDLLLKLDSKKIYLACMLVFTGKELPKYKEVDTIIGQIFAVIDKKYELA